MGLGEDESENMRGKKFKAIFNQHQSRGIDEQDENLEATQDNIDPRINGYRNETTSEFNTD